MSEQTLRGNDVILPTAEEVFAEYGYYRASLQQIADQASVGIAEVTSHYPDKATLLLAALTHRDDKDGHQVQLFDQPGGLELLRGLKAMIRANSSRPSAARINVMITAETIADDHPARTWALERYRWMRSLFAGALRRDIEVGLIRPDVDPAQLAAQVIAMMDGLQLQWLLEPEEVDFVVMFDAYIDGVLAAITA